MVKFTERFEKIPNVKKAVYLPNKLHLTIFYKEGADLDLVKARVHSASQDFNFGQSIETVSFYPE